jgi:hypothetical protein
VTVGRYGALGQGQAIAMDRPAGRAHATEGPVAGVSRTETNGFAVASLVLGIVWAMWIGSILALVFGYIAKNQIDRSGGRQTGRGMAVAGIVLGWVGAAFLLAMIALMIAGASTMPWGDGPMG